MSKPRWTIGLVTPLRAIGFAWLLIVVGILMILGTEPAAVAEPADGAGYRDFDFGSAISTPTGEKPQSKLWFNDGIWWGSLWDPISQDHHIYRFDWANQSWSDTGILIDTRSATRADTLWDGTHLYVASAPKNTSSTDQTAYVRRYSYN